MHNAEWMFEAELNDLDPIAPLLPLPRAFCPRWLVHTTRSWASHCSRLNQRADLGMQTGDHLSQSRLRSKAKRSTTGSQATKFRLDNIHCCLCCSRQPPEFLHAINVSSCYLKTHRTLNWPQPTKKGTKHIYC